MKLHNVGYLMKEGGRNVFANKLMSFACIGVLVACFLLIGSAVILSLTLNNVVEYVENQNEMTAFLDDGLTDDDIEIIGVSLQNLDNVSQVRFLSKEEGLDSIKVAAGEDADLYEDLEADNPLPDIYVIQINDTARLRDTVNQVKGITGVWKVNAQTEVASTLAAVKKVVNYAGSIVVLILIVVSMVIITNTIKLTVFSRRKEINIMKYVGATDSFIRMPFLVEGMLIGLLAAVFAFIILGFGYNYLLRWAMENYGSYLGLGIVFNSAVEFSEVGLFIFGCFAAIGIFIGTIGSGTFVRRYLRV